MNYRGYTITHNPPPIPDRGYYYSVENDNDETDFWYCESVEQAKHEIDSMVEGHESN